MISPLSTTNLPPITKQTGTGTVQITDDGVISLTKPGFEMRVSGDGDEVMISRGNSHVYSLASLPTKFHKYYTYLSNFVKVLRLKTPRITYKAPDANYYLMLCEECT
jgi:hypothetical protein